jgi:hypothetical protein
MSADDWYAGYLEWNYKVDGTGYTDVYRVAYRAGYLAAQNEKETL